MDLFRRKAKEPPAHKDERAHATIGAMERATAERMMKDGHLPTAQAHSGGSPLRGGHTPGLPSVPSALRRGEETGTGTLAQSSALPSTLPTTIPPQHEWLAKKPSKPGSCLRVLWKKDRVTRANFAWWDSVDGAEGGKMLRCSVLESDRRAISEFDLFPSGDGQKLLQVITTSEQALEFPYVTFSFLSADELGPPGMVFVAPPGVQYPIDSAWIKPSIDKQLERKQTEQERHADKIRMAKTEQSIREIQISADQRAALEKKTKMESKLKKLLGAARQTKAQEEEEYMQWKQMSTTGLPPPPQKHPIALLYEFEVQKQVGFDGKQVPVLGDKDDEDSLLIGLVKTFEVWSHNFNERYNIYLGAKNAINNAPMKLQILGFPLMKWQRTCVFDPHLAPSVRDSPGLCFDGKNGLLLFGGKTKGGDYKTYFNDLWRFDYDTNKWHMFAESTRVYDKGWKETVGLKGKKPTSRSSNTMLCHREAERGVEEDILYIAGGADRQGKCVDVRKLVIEKESPHYLRWNELIGENRKVTVDGDVAVAGPPPSRGFCCKYLCTSNTIFAPQLSDGEIIQLSLQTKQWKLLKFENFLAWRTSKLLCTDFEMMTRFLSVDFMGNSEAGYPGVETGEAWNIYAQIDEKDTRENAPKQWMLCPGQVMRFHSVGSFGDQPGTWSAHTLSQGDVNSQGPLLTRFYCFGGCRFGGKEPLASLPDEYHEPPVVGRDQNPRRGLRVKASPGFWQRSFSDMPEDFELDPARLGVITEVEDEVEHVDNYGRVTIEKTDQVRVNVRFDGMDMDLQCFCGANGIYDLHEFVDYDLYRGDARRRGGMMNELWTMDFMESVQVPQLLKRFDDLKNIRGHTDEFSLNQVLGKRIKIQAEKKQQKQRLGGGLFRTGSK